MPMSAAASRRRSTPASHPSPPRAWANAELFRQWRRRNGTARSMLFGRKSGDELVSVAWIGEANVGHGLFVAPGSPLDDETGCSLVDIECGRRRSIEIGRAHV